MQDLYGLSFASNIFRVWFRLRLKLAKLNVLCQFDSSLSASVLCIIGTFFDMSTAIYDFKYFAEFETFSGRINYYLFYCRSSNV